MRRWISRALLASVFAGAATTAGWVAAPGRAEAGRAPAKVAAKKTVSPAAKKKLAELYAGFKFGMTRDEVLGVLRKQLDAQYEERIKATTDVGSQDRLRAEKKAELARVVQSYTTFDGKRSGWDVSIVTEELGHHTGESMLERWENAGGKNQRRFFFFADGRLYKMLLSLDVSILPPDKKTFATFEQVMQAQYGAGDVTAGTITWRSDEFHVRAVDKLATYDALALVIEDPRVAQSLIAMRAAKAPPKPGVSPVIRAVIDDKKDDRLDVGQDSNAVDAVIEANGGKRGGGR
jgi:hypothetical protein